MKVGPTIYVLCLALSSYGLHTEVVKHATWSGFSATVIPPSESSVATNLSGTHINLNSSRMKKAQKGSTMNE